VRSAIAVATMVWCAGLWACKTHDELVVDVICEAVCPCVGDPDDVDACRAQCPNALDPADVSDECFACVLEASDTCAELVEDCDPVCGAF